MTEIKLMIQDNLYKKTTIFSKLYNSNIVKPNIQRDEMEEHVSEIYEHIMNYYNTVGKKSIYPIPYLGEIHLARIKSDKESNLADMPMYCIDGQHRLEAMKIFYKKIILPNFNDFMVSYTMFESNDMDDIEKRFHQVNTNKPLPNWKKNNNRASMLEEIKGYLMNKYKEHIKKSIKPQFPNIHRDRLIDHLESLDNFKNITSTDEYIKQLEEINNSLKKIYPNKAIKANLKQGLMLGLILNMPKKTISSKLRNQVWRKYNYNTLIGECTICKKSIDRDNDAWHCAHIKSEFNGGNTVLENLIPCCPDCNLQMGIQDANKYCMAKFKREISSFNLIPGSPV
jgi:hypothetical protein